MFLQILDPVVGDAGFLFLDVHAPFEAVRPLQNLIVLFHLGGQGADVVLHDIQLTPELFIAQFTAPLNFGEQFIIGAPGGIDHADQGKPARDQRDDDGIAHAGSPFWLCHFHVSRKEDERWERPI